MNKRLIRILIGGTIFLSGIIMFEIAKLDIFWLELALYMAAFVVTGGDIIFKACRNILRGKIFDENLLMAIATIGAFAISEFAEAVAVMLFYQVGEFFQGYAVGKSRKSIAGLMDIRPDYAVVLESGTTIKKSPEEVSIGDIIIVSAGEKIPLDGRVVDGVSTVDTSALTGESLPRQAMPGSDVISGCINLSGVLTVKVTKTFEQSTVSKILDLVENASSKKSNQEKFISKFARYYTPAVVIIAALLAAIPPLAFGADFLKWLYIALSFLVASCPCALVISIPMSFFGGLGGASRSGVLVKGGNYLEALAKTDTVVFDKTGTLTMGVFKVQKINAVNISEDELLRYTAYAESYSNHPVAFSLRQAYAKEIDKTKVSEVNEISGHGISARVDGRIVAAGNAKLMKTLGVEYLQDENLGTVVHVAIDGEYAGYILIADEIKPDSYFAIKALRAAGIKQTVMLTGDLDKTGRAVGTELGIDKVYTELLPDGKVQKLEELFSCRTGNGKIAFVGDGINDAPVLARADIGIAMGGLGSDAAIEAADIIIMNDQPSKIAVAKKIAKKTLGIASQNIVFAIAVKAAILTLITFGLVNMWMAIIADVGVTVVAVLNAFRALSIKKTQKLDTLAAVK